MSDKYLEYTHNNRAEDTVSKFFYKNDSLISGQELIDFLKYDGGSGKPNINRIYDKYNSLDKSKYESLVNTILNGDKNLISNDKINDLPIYENTILLIPKDLTKLELISLGGKNLFLDRKDFTYFWADKLYKLLSDKGYIRSENLSKFQGRGLDIEVIRENIQVWMWSRALNKIIDVSPFILNMNIDKSDVGSFSFSLNPIKNIYNLDSKDRENIINYFFLNSTNNEFNSDFFYDYFQYNDVVFIRFEKLQLEVSDKTSDYSPEIDKTQLPNQVWDMIGLIDSCNKSVSFSNSNYEVSFSGRDFMKLLIEDGSYFMNLALLQGTDTKDLIIGFNKEDKWFKRNIYNGKFGGKFSPYWFPNSSRSIRDTIGFIVNQLSNLGVLGGEDLFSSYSDNKRTQKYEISGLSDGYLKTLSVDGVWQIIKIFIDSSVDERRIVDDSISYVDGTILEQINKACQQPFVEFFGDTYGDEFNLVVRQPPFTKDMITSFLEGTKNDEARKWSHRNEKGNIDKFYEVIELEMKDLQGYNGLQYDTTYYSWFQLNPNNSFLGQYVKLAVGSVIPIIYFEEIAECFGNHRMIINDNYLNSNTLEGSESKKDRETFRRALLNDLKYVIDSNIYLPFTRKGTLTLIKGDRRIKKGTFIRVLPTREIFYVDSVSNSVSFTSDKVERSTTIRVSRGMIEDYIWGEYGYDNDGNILKNGGDPIIFSYFDIVRTIIKSMNEVVVEDTNDSDILYPKEGYIDINKDCESYKQLVKKYFPYNEVDNALRIMMAESKGNPISYNVNTGKNLSKKYFGSIDRGLYQINNVAHPEVDTVKAFDPEYNIQQAARIFNERGWSEWSTSNIPGVINPDSKKELTSKKNIYHVNIGVKNLQAFQKLNPGMTRSISDGELLNYSKSEDGFSYLMTLIENSKLKGDSFSDFLKYYLTEKHYSKTLDIYYREVLGVPIVSSTNYMKNVDSFELAKKLCKERTDSNVILKEEIVNNYKDKVQSSKKTKIVSNDSFDFSINKQVFEFFLKRKQLNIYKYGRNKQV